MEETLVRNTIKLNSLKEENGILTFTISGEDVSYINAIRRTLLSDIEIVIIKTTPYEENRAEILANTTALHNELIKQRLSCIPICLTDTTLLTTTNCSNFVVELDVENQTDTTLLVTTEHFKLFNKSANAYVEDGEKRKIFPPYVAPNGNEYYIEFVRLRPKLSDEIPGGKIKLTAVLSVGSARDDSAFNVTGTCSYGFTRDAEEMEKQLQIRRQKWKDDGMTQSEIDFETTNWRMLEGLRITKKNSFDFILASCGIYDNVTLFKKACDVLSKRFSNLIDRLNENQLAITKTNNMLESCYNVALEGEDHTTGCIINYELYESFYIDKQLLNYVGFKKMHPHDTFSVLTMSFDTPSGEPQVKMLLSFVFNVARQKIRYIRETI